MTSISARISKAAGWAARRSLSTARLVVALCGLAIACAAFAAGGAPAGQIDFYIGTSSGGGYDQYARILAMYLGKYLPGSPTFVFRNMPAGDGMALAKLVANALPGDGSVLAISPAEVYMSQVLTPGKFGYDVRKFGWVGTISTVSEVLAVYKSSEIATIEDAKRKSVEIGAVGPLGSGSMYPTLANALIGTKFQIVHGYPGGTELHLALDQGEVQGRVNQWNSWLREESPLIKAGKLNYLLQFGPKVLDGVPELVDLVPTQKDKDMVGMIDLLQLVGRSIYSTPDVPPERLAVLRAAFDKTMRDPDFLAKMKLAHLDVAPREGVDLQHDFETRLRSAEETGAALKTVLNIQ
jgi:tripartite-type tricarboxylate transporter receptor subunit TctC